MLSIWEMIWDISVVTQDWETGAVGRWGPTIAPTMAQPRRSQGISKNWTLQLLGTGGETQSMSLNSSGKGENSYHSLCWADMTHKDYYLRLIFSL